jgi:NDP-sugar pyrophosphorylase family protein
MRAMVLAAGFGTRLRPLTDTRPKALVEVGGRTLLQITLSRLRSVGIRDVIINVHHLGEMIVDYLQANGNFGMHVEISREDVLLDTGGGLKKAGWFFADSVEPFILHNVDVVSNIDLGRMVQGHISTGALATLAAKQRETSRYLLFDEQNQLCGRRHGQKDELARQAPNLQPLGFCGMHVISPRLLSLLAEEGVFSIVDAYLRLARDGERIRAFRCDEYYWRDLGRIESVRQAEQDLHQNIF